MNTEGSFFDPLNRRLSILRFTAHDKGRKRWDIRDGDEIGLSLVVAACGGGETVVAVVAVGAVVAVVDVAPLCRILIAGLWHKESRNVPLFILLEETHLGIKR